MAKRGNPNLGNEAKKAGTCFGMPNGNKPNGGGCKGGGKTFRQMISELYYMDEDELQEYIANKSNPAVVIRAAKAMLNLEDVRDVSCAADIVESKPAQIVHNRNQELPPVLDPIKFENGTNDNSGEDTKAIEEG